MCVCMFVCLSEEEEEEEQIVLKKTTNKHTLLGADKDVRNVLVLAQQGQVQQNLQRLGVGGHDNELGNAAVQSLGGCCVWVEESEVSDDEVR